MQRRQFIQKSSVAALGTVVFNKWNSSLFQNKPYPPFGIQLFTLMSVIDADTKGTLDKVAAIGYKEIESAFSRKGGFYGMSGKEFSKMVKDSGMHWRSHHAIGAPFKLPSNAKVPTGADGKPLNFAAMKNLKDNYQQIVDDVAEGGVSYLVCASIPVKTMDDLKTAVDVFNKTGEACKKAKIQFAYHNHATEFDQVEGTRPFDFILSNTDKDLVKMELDLGWASKAKQDPVELFKIHPGRFPLWHVKDFTPDFKTITEVGSGHIDFKRVFEHAKESGLKYFFIEQDGAPKPFENIATSYTNLKTMLS